MQSIIAYIKSFLRMSIQYPHPVQWKYKAKRISTTHYELHITALITHPWRLYSLWNSEDTPLPTRIRFKESDFLKIMGDPIEKGIIKEAYDKQTQVTSSFFTTVVDYVQHVQVFASPQTIKGTISYMPCRAKACDDLMEQDFQIKVS